MGLKKGFKSLTDKVERKARGTSTQEHASDSATLASFSHEANKQGLLRRSVYFLELPLIHQSRRAGRKRIDDFGERDVSDILPRSPNIDSNHSTSTSTSRMFGLPLPTTGEVDG